MKPAPFEYHRPRSIDEALAHLASLEDAKVLAGGQSLMAMMNFRYVTPAHVIDLNRIAELSGISENRDGVRIGAMTRQRDLVDSRVIRERCPLMTEALDWVGHIQTRNRGTIGGSVSHLDPSAELPGVLAAFDATLEVHGPQGVREVSIHDWPLAYMTPDLQVDELLVAINIPSWPEHAGHGFHELARRHGDFALAGAAVMISLDGNVVERVAISLIGVDDGPVRLREAETALTGQDATPQAIQDAADFAREVPGIEDVHASPQYRRKIATVMVRKALLDAVVRAKEAAS